MWGLTRITNMILNNRFRDVRIGRFSEIAYNGILLPFRYPKRNIGMLILFSNIVKIPNGLGHLMNSHKSKFYPNISTLLQIFTTLPWLQQQKRPFSTLRRINRFQRSAPLPDLRPWRAKKGNSKYFNFEKYLRKLNNFE